ncbi:hypothetical protein [Pseudomonas purpurea]|uniref:hypothetical protein n=1 Tax=Pseudomonas purpurea TaxID=3136737 RepID=UPI0032645DFF
MGQGGYVTLVNATDSDWELTKLEKYQMNAWSFPKKISARSRANVYVEWDQGIGTNQKDDAGEAQYTFGTSGLKFEVQARAKNGFNIQIYFENLNADGNPRVHAINWLGP